MAPNAGSRLGHYSVTAKIGEGGLGEIYWASQGGGKKTNINLNAVAVVGALVVSLALLGVMMFGWAIS